MRLELNSNPALAHASVCPAAESSYSQLLVSNLKEKKQYKGKLLGTALGLKIVL
jgi:hypothetical protein